MKNRYKLSSGGKNLTDQKSGIIIPVGSFEISSSGKFPMVTFNKHLDGHKQLMIARHTLDESEFSLGPAAPKKIVKKRQSKIPPLNRGSLNSRRRTLPNSRRKNSSPFTERSRLLQISRCANLSG